MKPSKSLVLRPAAPGDETLELRERLERLADPCYGAAPDGAGVRCAMLEKMNARTQQLLDEVLGLPATDRAAIAEKLEASLEDGEVIPVGVAVAWAEEAERRLREIEGGAVKAIPASEVHRQLREKFGLGR